MVPKLDEAGLRQVLQAIIGKIAEAQSLLSKEPELSVDGNTLLAEVDYDTEAGTFDTIGHVIGSNGLPTGETVEIDEILDVLGAHKVSGLTLPPMSPVDSRTLRELSHEESVTLAVKTACITTMETAWQEAKRTADEIVSTTGWSYFTWRTYSDALHALGVVHEVASCDAVISVETGAAVSVAYETAIAYVHGEAITTLTTAYNTILTETYFVGNTDRIDSMTNLHEAVLDVFAATYQTAWAAPHELGNIRVKRLLTYWEYRRLNLGSLTREQYGAGNMWMFQYDGTNWIPTQPAEDTWVFDGTEDNNDE